MTESVTAKMSFNAERRRWLDQVLRHGSATLIEKLTAFAISRHVNRHTGFTYTHPSTLAREIGVNHVAAREAVKHLAAISLLRIRQRGHLTDMFPVMLNDAPYPVMRSGSNQFQKRLRQWLDGVMCDKSFTQACRVAAYAVVAFTDPETGSCCVGHEALGDLVGLSKRTMQRSIASLQSAGRIMVVTSGNKALAIFLVPSEVTTGGQLGGQVGGQVAGHLKDFPHDLSRRCGGKPMNPSDPGNPSNIPTPSESALIAAQSTDTHSESASQVRQRQSPDINWSTFDGVCGLISNYFDETEPVLISGLIACAQNHNLDLSYQSDLHPLVKSGLLERQGNAVAISEAGLWWYSF
jgi:hypothetical protein